MMPRGKPAERITFRRLGEPDLPLLHRWLNAPHVLEWWDRPGPTLDQVRAKYLPRITAPGDVTPYVIRREETAIGYIQLYRVGEGAWGLRGVGSSAGVDLFIGELAHLHRGLGPRILRQFLTAIVFQDHGVEACFTDPSPRNRSAIRAFEKAGFHSVGSATDPESGLDVYLMRVTRQALEQGGADQYAFPSG
jgi:RimJ/RimL family protein N-acetyltransferase